MIELIRNFITFLISRYLKYNTWEWWLHSPSTGELFTFFFQCQSPETKLIGEYPWTRSDGIGPKTKNYANTSICHNIPFSGFIGKCSWTMKRK